MNKLEPLNQKIHDIVSACGSTGAAFADLIDLKRPILSHILKGRNKPSLEVIQKIVKVFPKLGMVWTFESESLSESQLQYVKENFTKLTSQLSIENQETENEEDQDNSGILNQDTMSLLTGDQSHISEIIVVYKNGKFKILKPINSNVKP